MLQGMFLMFTPHCYTRPISTGVFPPTVISFTKRGHPVNKVMNPEFPLEALCAATVDKWLLLGSFRKKQCAFSALEHCVFTFGV